MIRVVSAMMVAILCHPSTTWAEEFDDVERFTPELIEMSVDVVRQANDLGAIRTCPTERCLKHRSLKTAGKTALVVTALAALNKILTPATARAFVAGFATKSLARYGLVAIGATSAYFVVAVYAAYEATVSAISPIQAIPLADSIMFNDENRARFLAMPRAQVLSLSLKDPLLGHEIVILAHAVLNARAQAEPELITAE